MLEPSRSLPLSEWPAADRVAWQQARRPGIRLKPGGAANHLAAVSCEDYERRYGAFLGFLQRANLLSDNGAAADNVTVSQVAVYLDDLQSRVGSVTTWNCVAKLRRVAKLIAPGKDFRWLSEIENDLALTMEPRSKFDRFVFSQRIVEAGLTSVHEAEGSSDNAMIVARTIRNGLMVAALALCPIRLKNFAHLTIGESFVWDQESWWITLSRQSTKAHRPDDRRLEKLLYPAIDLYLSQSRPTLLGEEPDTSALWISSTTGRAMTRKNFGTLISKLTRQMVGIDVSPHLFRTAAASTSALFAPEYEHLSTALLGHADRRITEEHYCRVSSINASSTNAAIVQSMSKSSIDRNETSAKKS